MDNENVVVFFKKKLAVSESLWLAASGFPVSDNKLPCSCFQCFKEKWKKIGACRVLFGDLFMIHYIDKYLVHVE